MFSFFSSEISLRLSLLLQPGAFDTHYIPVPLPAPWLASDILLPGFLRIWGWDIVPSVALVQFCAIFKQSLFCILHFCVMSLLDTGCIWF